MLSKCWLICYELLCFLCAFSWSRNGAVSRMNRPNHCNTGVSFPGLGCFTLDPPYTNTNWLPRSPSSMNLSFQLFTRASPSTPELLSAVNRSSITTSHFDSRLPVKFIVHGFLQTAGMDFLVNMTRALLNKSAMNVIVVGWGYGAGFPYARAVANTRVVGAAIAQLIRTLAQTTGLRAQQVHIIGHSLGAHVGGYAGSLIHNLGRITGLDPAQPSFSGFDKAVRLDKSDARFVDIIHSDAMPYDTVRGYGIMEPVGHIDFYPNGGYHQPGCHEESSVLGFFEDAVHNGISTAEIGLSCSHERSTELFTSSISLSSYTSTCTFQAVPCQSADSYMRGECLDCGNRPCPIMGLDADKSFGVRGVFYLNTTGSSPFCGHHYFVALTLDHNMTYTEGIVSVSLRDVNGRQLNWKQIKEGQISGGNRITDVLLSDTDFGDVSQVDVKFLSTGDNLSWSSSDITLQKVEVDAIMRFPKKYFCSSNMTVPSGGEITLSSGTYDSSGCP